MAGRRRARAAGFDGVELFAAYHALVDQFWTPWSNRRTDRWGGSFENRMRFSVDRARGGSAQRRGDDFIIGLAVSIDPRSERSLSMAELQEIVAWHDERGADGLRHVRDRQLLRLLPDHPDLAVPSSGSASRSPRRSRRSSRHAVVQAESHIRTPAGGRGRAGRRPRRHGVDRPRPDRRPAPRRQGPRRPCRRTSGRASRATSCAGAAARATTGSRA